MNNIKTTLTILGSIFLINSAFATQIIIDGIPYSEEGLDNTSKLDETPNYSWDETDTGRSGVKDDQGRIIANEHGGIYNHDLYKFDDANGIKVLNSFNIDITTAYNEFYLNYTDSNTVDIEKSYLTRWGRITFRNPDDTIITRYSYDFEHTTLYETINWQIRNSYKNGHTTGLENYSGIHLKGGIWADVLNAAQNDGFYVEYDEVIEYYMVDLAGNNIGTNIMPTEKSVNINYRDQTVGFNWIRYDQVPEPSSISLLGLGIIGFILRRSR